MGAWGTEIMQNDSALDMEAEIEDLIRSGESVEKIITKLDTDNGISKFGAAEDVELVAFCYLLIGRRIQIPEKYLLMLNEITVESLSAWSRPSERFKVIEKFRNSIRQQQVTKID